MIWEVKGMLYCVDPAAAEEFHKRVKELSHEEYTEFMTLMRNISANETSYREACTQMRISKRKRIKGKRFGWLR